MAVTENKWPPSTLREVQVSQLKEMMAALDNAGPLTDIGAPTGVQPSLHTTLAGSHLVVHEKMFRIASRLFSMRCMMHKLFPVVWGGFFHTAAGKHGGDVFHPPVKPLFKKPRQPLLRNKPPLHSRMAPVAQLWLSSSVAILAQVFLFAPLWLVLAVE